MSSTKGLPLRNEASRIPLDENSIFELASVSKQFTAMSIVLLEESDNSNFNLVLI